MLPDLTPLLALQGFLDIFTNPATAWLIIPMLIFAIPIVEAGIKPITEKIKSDEREKLRKMYERITLEKLDVIKTAVAMGYQRSEMQELDSRLEEVIGKEAMEALLDGKASRRFKASSAQPPAAEAALASGELEDNGSANGSGERKSEKQ